MKSYRLTLLCLLSGLLFLSSCASVFEGRHYSHLNYVRVKKDQPISQESKASASQAQPKEIQKMVTSAERGVAISEQESNTEPKAIAKKNGRSSTSSALQQNQQTQKGFHPEDFLMKKLSPVIPEKLQKKMEEKSGPLFGDLDHDLRMALLFGIVGLIVILIGALLYGVPPLGEIFYVIGVILIIIGLIYLIKYLVENG